MTNRNVVGYRYLREATVLPSDPLKELDYTAPVKSRLVKLSEVVERQVPAIETATSA